MPSNSTPSDPWESLQADARGFITLAASLLAVSATFGTHLLSDDVLGRRTVLGAWLFLGLAIGASAYALGASFQGIQNRTATYSKAVTFLNLAVGLIGIGVLLLAFSAWRATFTEPGNDAIANAISATSSMSHIPNEDLVVSNMRCTESNSCTVTVQREPATNS